MEVTLDDKYTVTAGCVYLTGIQALVRLPLDQQRRDARAGLHTGAFITGYEGSPLAGYDLTLARTSQLLKAHNIVHQPAVNEELGATAVMGSQLVHLFPGARGITPVQLSRTPVRGSSISAPQSVACRTSAVTNVAFEAIRLRPDPLQGRNTPRPARGPSPHRAPPSPWRARRRSPGPASPPPPGGGTSRR